jgi:hypothetical protein
MMEGAMKPLLALFGVGALFAQAVPIPLLEYKGRPLHVAVECQAEQVMTLGLTCSENDPCPVYLELTGSEAVGAKLFLSGNLHTNTVTLESILLASEDGGRTWTEPASRIPMAGLDEIQFFDFETGWVSGQVQQALPRDPFFLITTDGGKSWRKQNVTGEPRVGAIERFRFESRTSGQMMIDKVQPGENGMRHELYQSMTGGENWTLQQVDSKPIPWKHPTAADQKDLRLREDAASKSYHLQKRAAGKWQLIASFAALAGDCKPAEPKENPKNEPEAPPNKPDAPAQITVPSKPPTLKKQKP